LRGEPLTGRVPGDLADRGGDDAFIVLLWGLVVAASVVLTPGTGGVEIFGHHLPAFCLWRALTGWRCPGCGLTRSFVFVGHGHVLDAFRMHLLGPPLYLAMVTDLVRRSIRLVRSTRARRNRRAAAPPTA
jgi:hypothetical protein